MSTIPLLTAKRESATVRAPRILIVRLTAIGDVIHGIPLLCALRSALPEAFIGWVAEGTAGDVLEGHPALNELIRVPRRWWRAPCSGSPMRPWSMPPAMHAPAGSR